MRGSEITEKVLKQVAIDLNEVLNGYLKDNYVKDEDFPVEFENELGRWKINADGSCYFQPIVGTQNIEVNITIKRTDE